jgi:polyhydroxyalkanoate synthase subunit PhaC
VRGNALVTGSIDFGDRTISVANITAPVLVFGGATDGIAPIPAVRTVVPLLTRSKEVRFEVVPGGHLGMLTGRRARGTTWQIMDEWITQWSSEAEEKPTPTARRKTAAKKAPAKKAPAKKATAKKAPARRSTPTREAIGTNPDRRYGSAGSRSLSR